MASYLYTFNVPDSQPGTVPTQTGLPTLQAVSGTWQVKSEKAFTSTPRDANPILAATAGSGKVDITADVGPGGDAVYIRVQDANNWLRARTRQWATTETYTYLVTEYQWVAVRNPAYGSGTDYFWCTSSTQVCFSTGIYDSYSPTGSTRQVSQTSTAVVTHNECYLERNIDGTITTLGTLAAEVSKLRIRAVGTNIQVFINGSTTAALTVTVADFATVARHGLGRGPSEVDITALDNLVIDPLNAAPYAPIKLTPQDGETINRHEAYRFKWTFEDIDAGDSQTAYELRYRAIGQTTWTTTGTVSSANSWWDAQADTFAAGDYEWQVAVQDTSGEQSQFSSTGFFTAGDTAAGPAFTDQVDPAVLNGPVQEWDYGVDLLDSSGVFVADISSDVTSMQVSYDTHATLHGDCRLSLTRDLTWGVDRVRPWIAVRDKETSPWYRWNLGVFVPTSPEGVAGETPRTRDVQGYDLLWLLQREIGDTYVVQTGVYYLDAIETVLSDAGVVATLYLQGNRWSTTLTEPAVWVLGGGYTWLDVINDLLGMIGYERLWADREGRLRSAPYLAPADRPTMWKFDSTDILTSIMSEDRRLSADVFDAPNLWRFVRNKDQALTNDDVYVVDHTTGLPAYQVRPKTVYVDAVDRDALEAEGDRIVAEDTAVVRTVEFDITPLPLVHGDVVELFDPELDLSVRCLVAQLTVGQDTEHLTLEVL